MNQRTKLALTVIGIYAVAMVLATCLLGCENVPTMPVDPIEAPGTPKPKKRIALSWEAGKGYSLLPETSDYLISLLRADLATFSSAKDVTQICPKYHSLAEDGKLKALGEFSAALAYYESSWNVKSSSVDVGKKENLDTYSVGLFQLSVVDQSWAGGGTKYSFADLQTSKPNIHLYVILMKRQIMKSGEIILPNASKYRYWAIILEGNKYQKISSVLGRVKANVPECY
ncbi:MAG: hypothetical protein KF767_08895 [Bdellovibrionaceae bacterium]|nr:hypothetical protein [Pseudobdellovibrionaceae bacterium]